MIASRFLVTTAAFALALASPSQRVEAVGEPIADDITLTKRDGIDCGPGDGVWAPGDIFETNVEFFCESLEYTDISDGYAASDTYLIKLSPQNGPAEDGKIICKFFLSFINRSFVVKAAKVSTCADLCDTSPNQERRRKARFSSLGLDGKLLQSVDGPC